jgi:hypothetical protein
MDLGIKGRRAKIKLGDAGKEPDPCMFGGLKGLW